MKSRAALDPDNTRITIQKNQENRFDCYLAVLKINWYLEPVLN
jgi:hypothetical protein